MLCIGHRGARGHAAENTLPSIHQALLLGAHAIEVDVHCCDGELVVIHDDSVDRTTNGQGLISQFTLAELRALDAGDGATIPLLSEVMDAIKGKAAINIELKGHGTAEPAAALIRHYRQRGWHAGHILVSSFDWELLADFREHDSDSLIGLLSEQPVSNALCQASKMLGSCAWNLHHTHIDTDALTRAHQHQQCVYAYTVNTMPEIMRLQQSGVAGVFTDYPERAAPYQGNDERYFGNAQSQERLS